MIARREFVLLPLQMACAFGQQPTHSLAAPGSSPALKRLRKQIDSGDPRSLRNFWNSVSAAGTPLIETIPDEPEFSLVTFLWRGDGNTRNVVVFDGVAGFEAKDQMTNLAQSDVWYRSYRVRSDARFAYNLSPNDSLQPFSEVKTDEQMQRRLAMLQVDPLNPRRCPTTFGEYRNDCSYVALPGAPPLLWESSLNGIRTGAVELTSIDSALLRNKKRIWIYTPAGFVRAGERYPLLVIFDGDRNVRWIPRILDLLIAHRQIPPTVTVMTDESAPKERGSELACSPQFTDFLAKELVPWSRDKLHATMQPHLTVVAGSSYGGLASVFAGLRYPNVFSNIISLSGSFWWKPQPDSQAEWLTRQMKASPVVPIRFFLEVGLLEDDHIQIEPNRRMRDTLVSKGYPVNYSEYDGGHSFLNWSQGMADGLCYLLGAKSGHKS